MFYHRLSVCLSVCLCARLLKKLTTDFDFKKFERGVMWAWPKEQSIAFVWQSRIQEFLKDSLFTAAIPIDSQK